ncbi:MAG: aldehyde dehydrogenase (NADP(+)) [Bacteroidetes bacterium]|nr:aldehyde dehydrogenase (NADP(+)) [Bacteroidota bacterium]
MITGKNYIGNKLSAKGTTIFKAFNPVSLNEIENEFFTATIEELNEAVKLSEQAFLIFSRLPQKRRAEFLTAIAEEIINLDDDLLELASAESGLPVARFQGERGRTVGQLKMFANLLEEGSWVEASIDTAIPDRQPLPKPDIRRYLKPLGPVAVFGASNFPLAFSTAGGDTASALAAGCPVIVKSHPAHPGTGELVASAIIKAAEKTGMPNGVFSNLNDNGFVIGSALVQHPSIKAVGFTGSLIGGRALFDLANKRKDPIPVYAEMGSINPVLLFNKALEKRSKSIAQAYAGSINLGVGQFCTNPGLLIGIESDGLNNFIKHLAEAIKILEPASMLTKGIAQAYSNNLNSALGQKGVTVVASVDNNINDTQSKPSVASTNGENFLSNPKLHEEVFGPYSLIVKCKDENELNEVVKSLEGQLTATIIAEEDELKSNIPIINIMEEKVGRIIYNGVPTGVEVCSSMHHGGPYPASTGVKYTSVGTAAIKRFIRPISFQDFPNELLPDELKNENPLNIWRLVNNEFTKDSIK